MKTEVSKEECGVVQREKPSHAGLLTMPPEILCVVWKFISMPDLYRVISSVHSKIRSTFPTLHYFAGSPLNSVTEKRGCLELQEYFRLPSISRLIVSFRWMDQGCGNRKGRLGLSIHRDGQAIIHHSFTQPNDPAPLHLEDRMYEVPPTILEFCQPSDEIVIWRYAGGGSSHIISVLFFHARYWPGITSSSNEIASSPAELSWPKLGPNPAESFHTLCG